MNISASAAMTDPRISIVIPVYNGARTLAACLDSVLLQSAEPFEVIVVDNGSTDGTANFLAEAVRTSPKMRVLHENRKGRAWARNAGVRAARGTVIAMIDADCVAPSGWLSRLCKPILDGSEQMVMGGQVSSEPGYWAEHVQSADMSFYASCAQNGYIEHIDTKNFACAAALLVSTLFDTRLAAAEDRELYVRLHTGHRVRFLPDVSVFHSHPSSAFHVFATQFERAHESAKFVDAMRTHARGSDLVRRMVTAPSSLPFLLVSGGGWACGALWARITGAGRRV